MLAVGDLEQARTFYESTLGLPVKFAVPQAGGGGYPLGGGEAGLGIRGPALRASARGATPLILPRVKGSRAGAPAGRCPGGPGAGGPLGLSAAWARKRG